MTLNSSLINQEAAAASGGSVGEGLRSGTHARFCRSPGTDQDMPSYAPVPTTNAGIGDQASATVTFYRMREISPVIASTSRVQNPEGLNC